jgi:hypothetical protein
MNGWVEQRAKQRDKNRDESEIIASGTEDLWKSLCDSVFAAAKQYAARFPPRVEPYDFIRTSPYDNFNEIWIEVMEPPVQGMGQGQLKRKVTLTLDRKGSAISTRYHGSKGVQLIRIGVTKDGIAGLFIDSHQVTLEQATEAILGPVLFPDLPGDAVQ